MKKIKLLTNVACISALTTITISLANCHSPSTNKKISETEYTKQITTKYNEIFSKYTKAQLDSSNYTINSNSFFHDDNNTKLFIKQEHTSLLSEDKGGERPELFLIVSHPQYTQAISFVACPSLKYVKELTTDIGDNYQKNYYETNDEWIIKLQEKEPAGGASFLQAMEYHLNKTNGVMMKYQLSFLDKDTKQNLGIQQQLIFNKFNVGQ